MKLFGFFLRLPVESAPQFSVDLFGLLLVMQSVTTYIDVLVEVLEYKKLGLNHIMSAL